MSKIEAQLIVSRVWTAGCQDSRLSQALEVLGISRDVFRRCKSEARRVTSGRSRHVIICPVGTAR